MATDRTSPQAGTGTDTPAPPARSSLTFKAPTFAALLPSSFLVSSLTRPSRPDGSTSKPPSGGPTSLRPSGRTPTQFRDPAMHLNGLAHTHGSSVVRLGNTSVVAGVMGEILLASDIPNPPRLALRTRRRQCPSASASTSASSDPSPPDSKLTDRDSASVLADIGLVIPNVELSTGCHPSQPTGSAPSSLAQALSQRVLETIHSTRLLPLDQLEIWGPITKSEPDEGEGEGEAEAGQEPDAMDVDSATPEDASEERIVAYWCLYIDIIILSLDGNPFDAVWAAVLAALSHTRLPHVWWNRDRCLVLADSDRSTHVPLGITNFPVSATFSIFNPRYEAIPITTSAQSSKNTKGDGDETWSDPKHGRLADGKWLLADPDALEESVCAESLSVIVDKLDGKCVVNSISRHGGNAGSVAGNPDDVLAAVEIATDRWAVWKAVFGGGDRQ